MYPAQLRGYPPNPNNQRTSKDGAVSGARPTEPHTQLAYEHGIRGQTYNRPTAGYPPTYLSVCTGGSSGIHSSGFEESRYLSHPGSTTPSPTPPATHPFPHGSAVETRGRAGQFGGWEVSLERAGEYPPNHIPGNLRRSFPEPQDLEGRELNYARPSSWNGSTHSHSTPLTPGSPSSVSTGGLYENQLPVVVERTISVPRPPHLDDHELVRNPKEGCYPLQRSPASVPTPAGQNEGRIDALEHGELSDPHSFSNGGLSNLGRLEASPPNPRSGTLHSKPSRVQLPGKDEEAERAAGPGKAVTVQKRANKRNLRDFTMQLRKIPVVTRGPTRLIKLPQTPYKCRIKQEDWRPEPPIEFGGIRLRDAVNKFRDLRDRNDSVFDYGGVGSSISCRLNFPGGEIGSWRIMTTNNKSVPEPITKWKLAYEIAKFVWRHEEIIKAEPGCADVAFANMVLVKLVRVAQASWQPELWYEVPVPGPCPS